MQPWASAVVRLALSRAYRGCTPWCIYTDKSLQFMCVEGTLRGDGDAAVEVAS